VNSELHDHRLLISHVVVVRIWVDLEVSSIRFRVWMLQIGFEEAVRKNFEFAFISLVILERS